MLLLLLFNLPHHFRFAFLQRSGLCGERSFAFTYVGTCCSELCVRFGEFVVGKPERGAQARRFAHGYTLVAATCPTGSDATRHFL